MMTNMNKSKPGRNKPCPCGSGKKYKKCCDDNARSQFDKFFSMTKMDYIENYLPHYSNSNLSPNTLIQFVILLPYEIPIYESLCKTMIFKDHCISIRFSDFTKNEPYWYIDETDNISFDKNYTKLELTYVIEDEYDTVLEEKEEYLNISFERLIEEVNLLIAAYQVSQKDSDVHYVTKDMLETMIPSRIIKNEDWQTDEGYFRLHMNIEYNKDKIGNDEMEEIIRTNVLMLSGVNPFAYFETLTLTAKRYFNNGFYQEAVIYAQISVETLIRTLYREFLIHEEVNEDKIETLMEKTSFMSMIKSELPPRVGGNWDLNKESSKPNLWYEFTYKLRNRIIHSGYMPSFKEADEAVYNAIEFKLWVVKQVRSKKKKYPKISEYFIVRKG